MRTLYRALSAVGFLIAFSAGVLWLARTLDEARVPPSHSVRLAGLPFMEQSIREMAAVPRRVTRVAFLGDSHVVGYPLRDRVPYLLQRNLKRASRVGARWRVYDLAMPGLGPFDFYFMAGALAEAQPSVVIVPVNLKALERSWYVRFRRPESAGWLERRRVIQTFLLPIQWNGLTADQVLVYMGARRLIGFERWRRWQLEQSRVTVGWQRLERALSPGAAEAHRVAVQVAIERRDFVPGKKRVNRAAIERRYPYLLKGVEVGHPILRVLAKTLETLGEGSGRVLVVVLPLNVEHFRSVGLAPEAPLRTTMGSLRAVARESGAAFLDLHDALSGEQFRDAAGHLAITKGFHGPAWLASELVEPVRALARPGR